MATYGYQPRVYGQAQGGYLRPASSGRFLSPIASALAGPSPISGTKQQTPALSPVAPIPRAQPVGAQPATVPQQTAAPVNPQGQPVNTAPTPGVYDLNTDPALQQITAFTGMSNEQAQAAALKQRQNQLLQYGDPNLAQQLLGDQAFAQAVGQNPTSTLHQLETQRQRNITALTEALNQANLLYGGYRVTQEQQAAQDYQNQLAQAAGGVNANLDTIAGNLAAALSGNQMALIQAQQAARDRALQNLPQASPEPTAYPGASAGGPTGYVIGQGVPIQQALADTGYYGGPSLPASGSIPANPIGASLEAAAPTPIGFGVGAGVAPFAPAPRRKPPTPYQLWAQEHGFVG